MQISGTIFRKFWQLRSGSTFICIAPLWKKIWLPCQNRRENAEAPVKFLVGPPPFCIVFFWSHTPLDFNRKPEIWRNFTLLGSKNNEIWLKIRLISLSWPLSPGPDKNYRFPPSLRPCHGWFFDEVYKISIAT